MSIVKIPVIIQARLNSKRLPKKVLTRINGIPLIEYLVNRLEKSFDRSQILIATSNEDQDNPIQQFCIKNNIYFFRGPLEDVAKRMLDAATHFQADAFVRINGDSPLIDSRIVKRGVQIFKEGKYDLVTNTFPRSFPIGQSVEIIKTKTFEKTYKKMTKKEEFEHVTKYYYNHSEDYEIHNFQNERNLSNYKLVVDTPEDLERIKIIINKMIKPHADYSMDELIAFYPK